MKSTALSVFIDQLPDDWIDDVLLKLRTRFENGLLCLLCCCQEFAPFKKFPGSSPFPTLPLSEEKPSASVSEDSFRTCRIFPSHPIRNEDLVWFFWWLLRDLHILRRSLEGLCLLKGLKRTGLISASNWSASCKCMFSSKESSCFHAWIALMQLTSKYVSCMIEMRTRSLKWNLFECVLNLIETAAKEYYFVSMESKFINYLFASFLPLVFVAMSISLGAFLSNMAMGSSLGAGCFLRKVRTLYFQSGGAERNDTSSGFVSIARLHNEFGIKFRDRLYQVRDYKLSRGC